MAAVMVGLWTLYKHRRTQQPAPVQPPQSAGRDNIGVDSSGGPVTIKTGPDIDLTEIDKTLTESWERREATVIARLDQTEQRLAGSERKKEDMRVQLDAAVTALSEVQQ